MAMSRAWLFRMSVAGNLFLLIYVALYSSSTSSPEPLMSPLPQSQSSSREHDHDHESLPAPPPQQGDLSLAAVAVINSPEDSSNPLSNPNPNPNSPNSNGANNKDSPVRNSDGGVVWDSDDTALGEGIAADLVSPPSGQDGGAAPMVPAVEMVNETRPLLSLPCDDFSQRPHYAQRGAYWVLYNYIRGEKTFHCDQSITYSTHADFTFLDNLVPLLERWEGPMSLSLYSPGTDFKETLQRILYLRECAPLVKDLVTFHLFFDQRHIPKMKIPQKPFSTPQEVERVNCSLPPTFGEGIQTYKKARKLPYPVNVARNVAREMSTTHFVLASDIELYPNPNLIPDFLEMIRLNDSNIQRPNPKVFVLSIFEVEENIPGLPKDKRELIEMLENKSAIPFHKYVCSDCHRIPKAKEWMTTPFTPGLRVFHVGKRHKPFHHWEPIYIGTKAEPLYDERLSWEGRADKMTQGYVLCVLDYEFQILDNAFLVHRPGIKRHVIIPKKNPVVAKQNQLISRTILPELKLIYGTRPGCVV